MNPDDQTTKFPAQDRAALREELLRHESDERLHVFDALNRQVDEDGEAVPEMPEGLRDKLLEQFGKEEEPSRVPQAAATAMAPAGPGYMGRIVAFFQQKPLAGYGGLAAAACAVLLIAVVLPNLGDDGGGKVDGTRGGGGAPAVTADVPVFLFPENDAAAVVALMSAGRAVVVCVDAVDFAAKMEAAGAGWAVAVDLERRVVLSFEDGVATGETEVGWGGAGDVLLGIRAALDRMVDGR